jgi:6-phosphogluconolactonase
MTANFMKNIQSDSAGVCRAAAEAIVTLAGQRVQAMRRFSIALAGGSTPKEAYKLLAEAPLVNKMPWQATRIYFGDERHVKQDQPESNYRMAYEAMLKDVPINIDNVFPMSTDNEEPSLCAEWYEDMLRMQFQRRMDDFPALDLILLGIGPDGHTASLFPGTPAAAERQRWVTWCDPVATNPDIKPPVKRITLTAPVIWHAANVFVMAVGKEKTPVIEKIWAEAEPTDPPVSRLLRQCRGDVTFFMDKAAAGNV